MVHLEYTVKWLDTLHSITTFSPHTDCIPYTYLYHCDFDVSLEGALY